MTFMKTVEHFVIEHPSPDGEWANRWDYELRCNPKLMERVLGFKPLFTEGFVINLHTVLSKDVPEDVLIIRNTEDNTEIRMPIDV